VEVARNLLSTIMPARRCCERLRHEHALIEQVVAGFDRLRHGRAGAPMPEPPISAAVEFLSAFVERCHDRKEEEGLFPVLEGYRPAGDALPTLHAEHEEGRRLLSALRAQSPHARSGGEAIGVLDAYGELLRRHIAIENMVILPFAERVLSEEDDQRVEHSFDRIEQRVLGADGRAVSLALAGAVMHACATMIPGSPTPPAVAARWVMRPRPAAVSPDESLARAAEVLNRVGSREVPVVAGGALVGILTRSDMEPHRGHYEWTAVRTAMTPDPVTVSPDTPATEVAQLLLQRGFNSMPVVIGRELLGMIACRDVLRVLAADPEAPAPPSPASLGGTRGAPD
jgi:CBS domain-containing protein/hemerythrin-like domain-containing protein